MKKIIFSLILGSAAGMSAQSPMVSPLAEGYLSRAKTMLDAANYAGVSDQLASLKRSGAHLTPQQMQEALWLAACASYEQGDEEAINLLQEYLRLFPSAPHAVEARLLSGDWFFFRHMWEKALKQYVDAKIETLAGKEKMLYTYRTMLCQLKNNELETARELLRVLLTSPDYQQVVTFYRGYIDYKEGSLDSAYKLFSQVSTTEPGLNPEYYLSQIDYTRGEYEKVARKGSAMLRQEVDQDLMPELNRITGMSYFHLDQLDKARPYLVKCEELYADSVPQDVDFALGVIDYENDNTQKAIKRFERLTGGNDALAQSAWLYLGQCDVREGNDDGAAMAFEKAARMDCDPAVSETAMFNYVAALTHGGKVPFPSTATMMEGFLKLYPNSEYATQIEEYLATAYYNDHDYTKALKSIEMMKAPSDAMLAAKQNILYELGMEAINNGDSELAEEYLRNSLKLADKNPKIAVQCRLWLADALYAQEKYTEAADYYRDYINEAPQGENRTLALYNCGYAYFQAGMYKEASGMFGKALDARPQLSVVLNNDARNRLADTYYYLGDFHKARQAYDQAARGSGDPAYPRYRAAVMLGLEGNIKGKIAELERLTVEFPTSKWAPNILLEKGMTYEALDQHDKGAEAFRQLAESYPKAAQARKGMINLAISLLKEGRAQQAADTYRDVIRNWPTSEEAAIANDDLRKYYASIGQLPEYAAFLKTVPDAKQLDSSEVEKLSFDAAETAFAENTANYELLAQYVSDYPDGRWLAPALFDIAYSLRERGNEEECVVYLNKLIESRPHSAQYPEALLMKGEILQKGDGMARREALKAFKELVSSANSDFMADAYVGIARTTSDPAEAIEFAEKARQSGVTSDIADELYFIEAEAQVGSGHSAEGLEIYRTLAAKPSSLSGAKAAVNIGRMLLAAKDYAGAEKEMLDFIDAGTSHHYQLAQGFIILADAYTAQGKEYLAKEYLQSLKENYPGDEKDIIREIDNRLKK